MMIIVLMYIERIRGGFTVLLCVNESLIISMTKETIERFPMEMRMKVKGSMPVSLDSMHLVGRFSTN